MQDKNEGIIFMKNMVYSCCVMAGRPPTKEAPFFGKQLAFFRKRKGLSQVELARKLHTTRTAIDYYERRAKNPTLDVIQNLAVALDIPIAELIGEDSPSKRKHPGPKSKMERQFEEAKTLPPKDQEFVMTFMDKILTGKSV